MIPARADEVFLTNGDRYSGMVVALTYGTLQFDTGHGRVDLPWNDVLVVSVDTPIIVTTDGGRQATVNVLASSDGHVTIGAETMPLTSIVAMARPKSPFDVSGGASAGLLSTSGNSGVNSLHLDADMVARLYENRYTVRGALNRAKDSGIETARDASGELRYDRFLTRTVFANASALLTNDRFRDLDLRSNLGIGLGYQIIDTARAKIGIEGGYGLVSEQFASQTEKDRSYSAARQATRIEVTVLGKRVTLFHRSDLFVSFSDDTETLAGTAPVRNINAQLHDGGRIAVGFGLVLTLQYDLDYTRSPAPGRQQTDRRTGLTFGYRF